MSRFCNGSLPSPVLQLRGTGAPWAARGWGRISSSLRSLPDRMPPLELELVQLIHAVPECLREGGELKHRIVQGGERDFGANGDRCQL